MKRKLITVLLSVMFIFSSFMTITSFAANPTSQDGLSATLTSTKSTYAANEGIDLSLTVINNNNSAVNGIQTKITLPDGITVKAGSLTQAAFSLAAGESKTNSPTVIKIVTEGRSNPQTNDSSSIASGLAVMIASAGALVYLAVKDEKTKSKSLLSLFLCLAILCTIGLPITASAKTTEKSFTVTKDLTVDGKSVTISAEISYGLLMPTVRSYSHTLTEDSGEDNDDPIYTYTIANVLDGSTLGNGTAAQHSFAWTSDETSDYGTVSLGDDGSFSFVLNNDSPIVQRLYPEAGDVTQTYNYTYTDADGLVARGAVVVTICGTNDAPIPLGVDGNIEKNSSVTTCSGNVLAVCCLGDGTQAQHYVEWEHAAPEYRDEYTFANAYGTFVLRRNGDYEFHLDNSLSAVQALTEDTPAMLICDYTAVDVNGAYSNATLTITIHA